MVVAPGTHHERIDFKGKAIEVRSMADQFWNTTISGDGLGTVVRFGSGEGRAQFCAASPCATEWAPSVAAWPLLTRRRRSS